MGIDKRLWAPQYRPDAASDNVRLTVDAAYRRQGVIPSIELELYRTDHGERRAGIDDLPEVLCTAKVALV